MEHSDTHSGEHAIPGTESLGSGELRLLLEIGRYFNSSLDLRTVLDTVMDKVIEVMKAERGCIMMKDENDGLRMVVARGMDRTTIEADDFAVSRNLVTQVATTGRPVLSSNAMQDPRFHAFGSVSLHALRSILAVPIIFKESVRGLIYVDNRIRTGVFKPENLDLLTAIANLAAGALENARLYEMKKQIILVL
ncbi:MAG TPA: GAF domain-containing protein, partial [Candidatus Nitrosotenuis sp.]|nr:GAF domain-containing protein [Candidatus Nitrosotenuis sp.]